MRVEGKQMESERADGKRVWLLKKQVSEGWTDSVWRWTTGWNAAKSRFFGVAGLSDRVLGQRWTCSEHSVQWEARHGQAQPRLRWRWEGPVGQAPKERPGIPKSTPIPFVSGGAVDDEEGAASVSRQLYF